MVAVLWIKTVADVRDLSFCIGQDVCVWFVVGYGAVIERVWLGRIDKSGCGWMTGEEGLEGACSRLEGCYFFGCVAFCGFSLVERSFGSLEGAKDLQEGEKVFAGSSRKAIECVTDQICVRVPVYQEANSESFWSGTIIYIWYVWDTSANRETCHDWSRRIAEMRSQRE